MQILSHRGNWQTPDDKNSPAAFVRALEKGFGIELDVRDAGGKLVVSHDPPTNAALELDAVLSIYGQFAKASVLAINIKADGLHTLLKAALDRVGIRRYFVFDMSIPDTRNYIRSGLRFFSRHSDVESPPLFYAEAAGIWLDAFFSDWVCEGVIAEHLANGKYVCLVSPELHGRPHLPLWEKLQLMPNNSQQKLMLCTDYPDLAWEYFHE